MKLGSLVTISDIDDEGYEMYVPHVITAFEGDYILQVIAIRGNEITVFCPHLNTAFNVYAGELELCSLDEVQESLVKYKWYIEPVISFELKGTDELPVIPQAVLLSSEERKQINLQIRPISEDDEDDGDYDYIYGEDNDDDTPNVSITKFLAVLLGSFTVVALIFIGICYLCK